MPGCELEPIATARSEVALSVKVFLLGDWFAPFFFLLPTLEFALLVFSQRLLSEREHFHDCPV